jgi:hypothetical protein
MVALLRIGTTANTKRQRKPPVEGHGGAQIGDGLVGVAQFEVHHATRVMRRGEGGIHGDSLVKISQRHRQLVATPHGIGARLLKMRAPSLHVELRLIGIEPNGSVVRCDRLIKPLLLRQPPAADVMAEGVVGVRLQQLGVIGHGCGHVAQRHVRCGPVDQERGMVRIKLQSGGVFGDRTGVVAAKGTRHAARVIVGRRAGHERLDPIKIGLDRGLVAAVDLQGCASAERERVVGVERKGRVEVPERRCSIPQPLKSVAALRQCGSVVRLALQNRAARLDDFAKVA